jgi:hypothetical protein
MCFEIWHRTICDNAITIIAATIAKRENCPLSNETIELDLSTSIADQLRHGLLTSFVGI